MKDLKVLYLCDKQKEDCEKTNCSEEFCHHTSDVSHAINFEKIVDTASGEVVGYVEKESEWIPVTERLPEEMEKVLIWFEYYRYGDYNCMFQTYGFGYVIDGKWSPFINGETGWRDYNVIAWMPLPEGYKSEVQHEDS